MSNNYRTGKKVALRGLARDDLESYRRWLDDPKVTRFLEMGAQPTRAPFRFYIRH